MVKQVLVATLGTEPQVVTLTLDLLLANGYDIGEVIVVHTVGNEVQAALTTLAQEFSVPRACNYRSIPVGGNNGSEADVVKEEETAGFLRTLYRIVLAEKRSGRVVHLSITGGRKTMAVYGMVVAQLLFDEEDRVWYLLSKDWKPGDKRVMHVRLSERVWLVPVPVLRWSSVSPVLTVLALREDPWESIQAQRAIRLEENQRRKQEFLERWLSRAEREVVRLACLGLDNAAIARHLHKSERTVANQLTSIYAKLHEWRGFRTDVPVSRAVLVAEFAGYFAMELNSSQSSNPPLRYPPRK